MKDDILTTSDRTVLAMFVHDLYELCDNFGNMKVKDEIVTVDIDPTTYIEMTLPKVFKREAEKSA